ncbi:MAG TPA: thiamine phosphate synthase [Actinomycetota bacterium]|jgi:thiamine-phosphate pyrophosphorylase
MRDLRRSLAVYVVTSSGVVPGRDHLDVARAAIEGGAGTVQLRAPELQDRPGELLAVAEEIAALCRPRGVLFIVNNVLDVAVDSGAAGVHLGQGDEVASSRQTLGPDRVLGVSVETPEQARAAERLGSTYLGVTVFSTATKPEARPVGLEGMRDIVSATSLPVVGIGGIDASNAPVVLSTGAAGVAAISAVGGADDPVQATRELVAAVEGFLRQQGFRLQG